MKVYVTYDPLNENIICVHVLPNIDCPECKLIREDRLVNNTLLALEEIEKEVQDPNVKRYDSPAILDYYSDEEAEKRREQDICSADEEDSQPDSMLFHNPKTGKLQKLFDVLNKVYNVCYRNPEVGDKGEALYITVEAEDHAHAIEAAMKNKDFIKHIEMKYFNLKYFNVYEPKENYVIGKVDYYEGDPRL